MFVEGTAAEQQLVGHHPEAPVVRLRAVHVVLREHLWCIYIESKCMYVRFL